MKRVFVFQRKYFSQKITSLHFRTRKTCNRNAQFDAAVGLGFCEHIISDTYCDTIINKLDTPLNQRKKHVCTMRLVFRPPFFLSHSHEEFNKYTSKILLWMNE